MSGKKLFWVWRAAQMHFKCDSHDFNMVIMVETLLYQEVKSGFKVFNSVFILFTQTP